MAPQTRPTGYSTAQIALHWLIAALVTFQLIFGEAIVPAYRAVRRGTEATAAELSAANLHVYVGLAVLALAVLRFAIRMRHGVPPAPPGESAWQRRIAGAAHLVLYGVIFAMPLTGALAWFAGVSAMGAIHELAKPLIILTVALHAAGALWQHFVAKTDVLLRMLRPEPRRGA
ncbi:MAG TPA: cytochrome b/b6 domain-containing protein [Amaricoccus sp.]|uniref:cytochrome b n=1 Tax=Amaricoccus sp. TaxID=1872485 RepID=UPI002C2B12EE|nr:cytochrome b/b6 domain-containing protein [Amaricoccus sp.]HMQ93977.1 cytochrome b/b6 domain-containing protein [Amaricoccus sp.]HMR52833.1 cytochrome b/b6 domain-containing protein [Amaricoccus sp.]HMR60807.1 cytochrome b/b6 domain-containing protein [Amaricoccus sp.]HMT99768.1 cytochrome b/b6 domain-containing protein [Amaricoccus sp.]